MKKTQRWFLLSAAIFYATFATAADAITYKMAANFDSEPFVYRDKGHIVGFEVDLIREIGKLKGFDVQFVPAIFPEVFRALKDGEIDFIGHVYNDEERRQLYNLTKPHYVEEIEFLTLSDKELHSPFTPNLTIATLAFSPMEEEFQRKIKADYPTLQDASAQTTYLGFKDLFLKKADVLLTTQTNIERLQRHYPQYTYQTFHLPDKYQRKIYISFLTAKDNPQLAQEIDQGLETLRHNGTYDRLKQKYHL